jgi:hypothetical protein
VLIVTNQQPEKLNSPMPRTTSYNRSSTLALVCALLFLISSYPQPVIIPSTPTNKYTKKLFYKKIPAPAALAEWVSVAGLFTLPIMQQPDNNPIYVANKPDILTQFQQATQNGITGLLAHNFLSGKEFSKLKIGQEISITYTDHIVRNYRVASIYHYQKLDPSDLFSDLIDLHTDKELSTREVFNQFYRGRHHVAFQTCLEKEGRLDWGLLFVIALPIGQ